MLAGLRPLRVAAVQAESVAGEVEANVATACRLIEAAAAEGAKVAVLPELFLPGYDPGTLRADPDGCDVTVADPRLAPLRRTAENAGVASLVGASTRAPDGSRRVSALSFGPDGRVEVAYSKQHLWDEERGIFSRGEAGAAVELGGWQLGLGICYDACFPEHARAASEAGALAYLCPAAYVVGSEHRRDLYYAARAIDNAIYVVFAGLVGRCGELEFSGGSAIYDPQGRPVARVRGHEGIAVADLDPAEIAEARRINPYDRDRVADLGGHTVLELSVGAAADRRTSAAPSPDSPRRSARTPRD
jgi:predicted amidohydrolase